MKHLVKARLVAVVLFITTGLLTAQTFNLYPNQVPKGAYVNGNDGDQQFIQTLKYTVGTNWTAVGANPEITITLPDSMNIANWDYPADALYSDEITIIDGAAAGIALGTVSSSSIELEVAAVMTAGEWIEVTFPIETQSGATGSQNYTIAFDALVATETDGTVAVSYEDTLSLVSWEADYAGNDDQSGTLGEDYPDAAAASFFPAGGLDIVRDLAAATVTGNQFFDAALDGTNDNGEALTYIWASQTPSLKRLNNMNAHRPWNVGLTARPTDWDGTETVGAVGNTTLGATYQLDGELLAEGYWFFYLTSGATGNWALAMSDSVLIRHWPTFNTANPDDAGGFDYGSAAADDAPDGVYVPGGGDDDVTDVTIESGGTIAKDGALPGLATQNLSTLEFFWDFQDLDDNAVLDIFLSPDDDLTLDSVVVSGSDGSEVVTGIGSNSRKITPTSILEESSTLSFTYDIYSDADTYEPAGDYYVYYVANDGTNQGVYQLFAFAGLPDTDEKIVHVKHYPYFKFDDVYSGSDPVPFNTGTDEYFVLSWGQTPASGVGDGDLDADDNATITFYYSDATTGPEDLATIVGAAAPLTVLDAGLLTHAAWTGAVTRIGSTKEDPDTKADNRYMWNIGAESPPLSELVDWVVIAHIQGGTDHLFVQYTQNGGPEAAPAVDREIDLTHGPYFRPETPLAGETIVLDGNDDFVFDWTGYDHERTDAGLVQAFMAPAGSDISVLDVGGVAGVEWQEVAGAAGYYWLFPTATGQTSSGATSGPSFVGGTYTLDVDILTTTMAPALARPSGFYDVYYFYKDDATVGFAAEIAIPADGVLRFLGTSESATNFRLTPNKSTLSKGDTVTVLVQAESPSTAFVSVLALAIDVPSTYYTVIDQGSGAPFIGESSNFTGSSIPINSMTDAGGYWQLDYVEIDGSPDESLNGAGPVTVASFQVIVGSSGSGTEFIDNEIVFVNTATRTTGTVDLNGNPEVVTLADPAANFMLAPPGTMDGQVELEILNDEGQSVDVHIMPRGSYTPISDADFLAANGGANSDGSISVTLGIDGAYEVTSIPTGDYDVIMHKAYHLDQLETDVEIRPVTTTTVDFQASNMLLAGDIAGWDHDTDASTDSQPDNQVNTDDVTAVSDAFGSVPGGATWNAAADFNADNYVYISDYNVVTTNSVTNGEGLLFKGTYDANRNVQAELLAMDQSGDEVTYAVQLVNLSSLHAYAVEMEINSKHWELLSYADGMADFHRAADFYKLGDFDATFASGIIGRDAISAKEMTLVTMTLKAKVSDPEEISISSVSLVDGNGRLSEAIMGSASALPAEFALSQNYPNPFNPTTNISFSLPVEGQVKLAVYNLLGQEITTLASGLMDAGMYKAVWNGLDNSGRSVSTGMYFYRLMVDNRVVDTKKMLFLK